MEIVLIIIGLLIMSGAGLWYLGVAFSESLFWGLALLGLSVSSVILSTGSYGGDHSTELTLLFQISHLVLSLTFLFKYWEVVKKPFFLTIFGGILFAAGIALGGMSLLSSQGSSLMARLSRSDSVREQQASISNLVDRPPEGHATADPDMKMFDAMAKQYEQEKDKGMSLDPRYDQAVRDYQAMRARESGSTSGSGRSQGSLHGGSSGPNPEPEPLIGKRTAGAPPIGGDFTVSSSELLAASKAAKRRQAMEGSGANNDPWYREYKQATRPTIAAWQRVHLAMSQVEHRKDLAPACQELVKSSSGLSSGTFSGAPDERIALNLSQAYESLRQIGRDCLSGKMSAVQTKMRHAAQEMERARQAMLPFGMKP